MQTFVPLEDFQSIARALDWRRLGKQRVECAQILWLLSAGPEPLAIGSRWLRHPAVLMWRGHVAALAYYGLAVCDEWRRRGYRDNMARVIARHTKPHMVLPHWWDGPIHASHRSTLLWLCLEIKEKINMARAYATQDGPFCIQIELCEGCNLRCTFCGLQGIRAPGEKNYKFMQPETLRRLLTDMVAANWNPRLEFAMHGEPTMHPDYVGMIRVARESAPRLQIMLTSNAGGLLRRPGAALNILDLFTAGLNVLALDDYDGAGYVPKVRASIQATPICVPTYEYPDDKRGNPHMRRPLNTQTLVYVRDIQAATRGNHATLTNHAGCGAPALREPLHERCAKPFRELGVRWDGSVAMCCNDWRGIWKVGNINQTNVTDLWNSSSFGAARELLFAGDRTVGPCRGCDYHTYRNGLLPDKMGKRANTMHAPDEQTRVDAANACAGASLTRPHLNPWER